ncbi:MAG: metallophosphoesterase [Fibromonadaceae bacterium]|jgi:undecaprenyl-diphosphatase|nr:metallophosphoesterase [Fibromonadaceae bacterium]
MLEAIIIGLIQGLTEFLPISSTGHMLIYQIFVENQHSDAFNVLIQVGSILAAITVFWRDILNFFHWKDPIQRDYVIKLFASFCITGVGGFIAKVMGIKLPEEIVPIALALLIGGFIIIGVETRAKKMQLSTNITWAVVVAVGIGQLVAAIFPGSSRSGMAIMGALLVGLARPEAVKFAFLVGIPTMFSAGGYQLLKALKASEANDLFTPEAFVAYAVAAVSSWLSVIWLLKFIRSRSFIPFAWYRIVLGIGLIALSCFSSAKTAAPNVEAILFETIGLSPGTDATELNLNWYSDNAADINKSFVRILDAGNALVKTEKGTSGAASANKLWHKVTVKGLLQGTQYKYQVSSDSVNWSDAYNYTTIPTGTFKFAVIGDAQLTDGMQDSASDFANKTTAEGWATSVGKIASEGASFIISTGDQVDQTSSDSEVEYKHFYAPAGLRSLPFAPVVGNHDRHCLFMYHFNLPNDQTKTKYPVENCASARNDSFVENVANYYYLYNRVLFIALNTSSYPSSANAAEHYITAFENTIQAAKTANAGKYDWLIVHHHKSTQSVGAHVSDTDIQYYVEAGFERLMAKHSVNLVFAGHDHIYVRSQDKGTTYITVTTSSGLKYYPAFATFANGEKNTEKLPSGMHFYKQNQLPEYTIVEVNDTAMSVVTKTITEQLVDAFSL